MLTIPQYSHILYVGDLHARTTTPASRVDDFRAAQRTKLDAIFEISRELRAPIVFTGDLFDRPDPPYALVTELCELFLKHAGAGIYTVPGNHDVYGATLQTLHRSALGVMVAARAVALLQPDLPHTLETPFGYSVNLYGSSYMHPTQPKAPPLKKLKREWNVLVTHEMVLADRLYREPDEFVTTEDFVAQHRGWDLIVCGHYHYRFCESVGTCRILNPGAVVRIKASKGDMDLVPAIYVWDLEKDTLTTRVLPHAPAQDVFIQGEKTAQSNAQSEAMFTALLSELQTRGGDSIQVADVVHEVLAKGEYPDEVRTLIQDRLVELQAQETGLGKV